MIVLSANQYTKVLVPASLYNMQDDNRLLVPFTSGDKIGFVNKEVLPLEYDSIWTFYGKKRVTTKVIKGNVAKDVILSELLGKDKTQKKDNHSDNYDVNVDDCGTNYGAYAGSYAQDVEGYSDDVIDDAFDGDPDAYWNID